MEQPHYSTDATADTTTDAAEFLHRYFDGVPGVVYLFARGQAREANAFGRYGRWRHWLYPMDDPGIYWHGVNRARYLSVHWLWQAQFRIATMQGPQPDNDAGLEHRGQYTEAFNCRSTGGEKQASRLPAFFADLEYAPLPQMYADLKAFALPPSIVMESSRRGLHVYWLLDYPLDLTVIDDWPNSRIKRRLWGGLCDAVNSDRVNKVTTWGRLPGFMNTKPDYAPHYPITTITHLDWAARYELGDFERWELPEPKRYAPPPRELPVGDRGRLPERALNYLANPPGAGDYRHDTAVFVACQLRDARYTENEALSQLAGWQQPGFTWNEIKAVVRDVYNAPPRAAIPTHETVAAWYQEEIDAMQKGTTDDMGR